MLCVLCLCGMPCIVSLVLSVSELNAGQEFLLVCVYSLFLSMNTCSHRLYQSSTSLSWRVDIKHTSAW